MYIIANFASPEFSLSNTLDYVLAINMFLIVGLITK